MPEFAFLFKTKDLGPDTTVQNKKPLGCSQTLSLSLQRAREIIRMVPDASRWSLRMATTSPSRRPGANVDAGCGGWEEIERDLMYVKLLGTSATLVVTGALLVVTRSY